MRRSTPLVSRQTCRVCARSKPQTACCAKRLPSLTRVYDLVFHCAGGDTVDTATFMSIVDSLLPGAAALITIKGGDIPIASKIDDAALRADFPGLLRIPLKDGIAETVKKYQEMEAAGILKV